MYLWAVTAQLFSAMTFGLLAYDGVGLSPGAAFASIALFQGLITPLNAFPWVVNGAHRIGCSALTTLTTSSCISLHQLVECDLLVCPWPFLTAA